MAEENQEPINWVTETEERTDVQPTDVLLLGVPSTGKSLHIPVSEISASIQKGQPLNKNTMEEMRSLTDAEIDGLVRGIYSHVQLNGYYEAGDTPSPLNYYISSTALPDDSGFVVYVSDIKLQAQDVDVLSVKWYGAESGNDCTSLINRAITYANANGTRKVLVDSDLDVFITSTANRWDTGVMLKSNIDFIVDGILRLTPNRYINSVVVSAHNISNFNIYGSGTIIGDKNHHLVEDGSTAVWKVREPNTTYQVGDYIAIDIYGFIVTTAGTTSSTYPTWSGLEIGSVLTDGTVVMECVRRDKRVRYNNTFFSVGQWIWYRNINTAVLVTQTGTTASTQPTITDPYIGMPVVDGTVQGEVIHIGNVPDMGEWGMGLTLKDCHDFSVKDLEIKECWGDAIYVLGENSTTVPNEGCYNFIIDNVNLSDCRRQGISVLCAKNFLIDNLTVDKIIGTLPMAGIDLEPEQYNVIQDGLIGNCKFHNCIGGGIKMSASKPETNIRRVRIDNVLTNDCGVGIQVGRDNVSDMDITGLSAYNSTDYGLRIFRSAENISVSGVHIDTAPVGISVEDENENVSISDVKIYNTSGSGIDLTSNSNNVRLSNIYIDGAQTYGLYNKSTNNLTIDNITVKNSRSGIYMFNGVIENLVINGGYIDNIQRDGLYLNMVNGVTVTGLTIRDVSQEADDTHFGLRFGATSDNFLVSDINFLTSTTVTRPRYSFICQSTTARGVVGLNRYGNSFKREPVRVEPTSSVYVQRHTPIASVGIRGIVAQSPLVNYVTATTPTNAINSTATDVAGLVTDFNTLVGKFNTLVALSDANKLTLNNKLLSDTISGQQVGSEPVISALYFNFTSGVAPYTLTVQILNKSLIDNVVYRLEARALTQVGVCSTNTFPGTVSNPITNALMANNQYTNGTTVPSGSCYAVTVRVVRVADNSVVNFMTANISNL